MLLTVVAEKTGYPREMIDPAMDLEADLGIDSIKRGEILSDLQARLPESREVPPDEAARLRTLREVLAFLTARAAAAPSVDDGRAAPIERRELCRALLDARPAPSLALPAGAAIWIVDDGSPLPTALAGRISGWGFAARVLSPAATPATAVPPELAGLVLLAPHGTEIEAERFASAAFATVRQLGPALRRAATAGSALSPRTLETRYREVAAGREIARTLDRIQGHGAKAVYVPVNVRDAAAVGAVVARPR